MAVYCTKCGTGWAAGEKFCRKCGTRLSSGDLVINPPSEPTSEIRGGVETTTLNAVSAERFKDGVPFETEPTLPMYAMGQRAVGSKAPDEGGRSRKIARALNVAVGLTIVALAIGLVVIYLGSGRPTTSVSDLAAEQAGQAQEAAAPAEPETANEAGAGPPSTDPQAHKPQDKEVRRSSGKEADTAQAANGTDSAVVAGSNPSPANAEPKPDEQNAPSNVDHIKRGLDLYYSGKYSQAITEFQTARRLQPANGDLHYLMAMAYEKMGRPADALAAYEKCKSGNYAALASQHVKRLSKKLNK